MKGFPDLMCTLTGHRVDFVCLFGSVGICLHYTIIFPPKIAVLKGIRIIHFHLAVPGKGRPSEERVSECGPQNSSISLTWELTRTTGALASTQTFLISRTRDGFQQSLVWVPSPQGSPGLLHPG